MLGTLGFVCGLARRWFWPSGETSCRIANPTGVRLSALGRFSSPSSALNLCHIHPLCFTTPSTSASRARPVNMKLLTLVACTLSLSRTAFSAFTFSNITVTPFDQNGPFTVDNVTNWDGAAYTGDLPASWSDLDQVAFTNVPNAYIGYIPKRKASECRTGSVHRKNVLLTSDNLQSLPYTSLARTRAIAALTRSALLQTAPFSTP